MNEREWFTVEQIDGDTFVISEYGHWEEPHCYLLCGTHTALLIDTGLGVADIRSVAEGLTTLPILAATTHVHWDHIGGHRHFHDIAVFEAEASWLSDFPIPLSVVKKNLTCKPCCFPDTFDIDRYTLFSGNPTRLLRDRDVLNLGNRRLEVIHTPGHSPGHCCFYEAERGYLFSGDLLYMGCLDAFYPTTDPKLFWKSVQRVEGLPVTRILPGHQGLCIPADLVQQVDAGFQALNKQNGLRQGSGLFDFGAFQIHL